MESFSYPQHNKKKIKNKQPKQTNCGPLEEKKDVPPMNYI